jgi:hypothetical protein
MDIASIQKYVFCSNRLKENIGASIIVEEIFSTMIPNTLHNLDLLTVSEFSSWEKITRNSEVDFFTKNKLVEIGYIGGGNALILFSDFSNAKEFTREITKNALLEYPGIKINVCVTETNNNEIINNFEIFMNSIFSNLVESKNKYFPNVSIPKFGITKDCALSGNSIDSKLQDQYISSESKVKIEKSDSKNNKYNIGNGKYSLTNEINKLGQKSGNNWIGVVHIDGNNMGEKFQNCKNLNQLRYFSSKTKEIANTSFTELLEKLQKNIEKNEKTLSNIMSLEHKHYPIREILIGGDDITFVCNANFAIYLAETYIKIWTNNMNTALREYGLEFSACAGIAIVKTKHPFYQSYKMSENLCTRAKSVVKKLINPNTSAIDFYIHNGGISGDLDSLIDLKYTSEDKSINNHYGPYLLGGYTIDNKHSIDKLIQGIHYFYGVNQNHEKMSNNKIWPRSKLKELRENLCKSTFAFEDFIKDVKTRGLDLPKISSDDIHASDTSSLKLPYLNMIEIMEFYPENILAWRS